MTTSGSSLSFHVASPVEHDVDVDDVRGLCGARKQQQFFCRLKGPSSLRVNTNDFYDFYDDDGTTTTRGKKNTTLSRRGRFRRRRHRRRRRRRKSRRRFGFALSRVGRPSFFYVTPAKSGETHKKADDKILIFWEEMKIFVEKC